MTKGSLLEAVSSHTESYYLTKYDTYEDLHSAVKRYVRYYNNYRYTERLGGMSPNEYRRAA
ncbi:MULTISPECIES: IS3 family transposase [unclassified Paenibacillus]|uniref:IS3 family transposase n=1 Tax=unclassified Paenibacillus TaxID=185978 RepID=UPI000CFDAE21|nr:IS3 family transposase [Paenibacillus sp. CFBP 13594]PRA08107.1 hypothetical protein CQ043_09795 [Paenibacillus sp. MYb63]PRA51560.1 hypothetical protein CQ061_02950 [Paenibacillus sp. MYb67]QZN78914.1 IS3 family transposase [Paenibacillus sp. DR312]